MGGARLGAVLGALPHGSGVPVGRIVAIVAAMETAVSVGFDVGVAPFLPVVVLVVRAVSSFGGVELMLGGGFLKVIEPQVLLGVVVPVEGLLLPQVEDPDQRQQQQQEQGPAHCPAHHGTQITLGEGFEGGGAEEDMLLIVQGGGGGRTS